jgi:hypothetical protein
VNGPFTVIGDLTTSDFEVGQGLQDPFRTSS